MMLTMPAGQNKRPDNRGVTLVEVMISLVILLIVFMGLIQASLLSIEHNMKNEMRDEAVRIAAATVERLKQTPFQDARMIQTGDPATWQDINLTSASYDATTNTDVAAGKTVWRYIRNIRQSFTREIKIQNLDAASDTDPNLSLKRVEVRVKYSDPKTGEEKSYTVSTTVGNK